MNNFDHPSNQTTHPFFLIKFKVTRQNFTIVTFLNFKEFNWVVFAALYAERQTGRRMGGLNDAKRMCYVFTNAPKKIEVNYYFLKRS